MKNIKFLFKTILVLGIVFTTSCESDITELDLTENPNFLTPDQKDPDLLLNAIQIDFANNFEYFQTTAGEVTRLYNMNGLDYSNAYGSTDFDRRWRIAYADMFMDIKILNEITNEKGMIHHEAMAQVLQAYMLTILVDHFGDVPYSEILNGFDNLNPIADSGQSVYQEAYNLLDDAIIKFGTTIDAQISPKSDLYYANNWDNWIKAANTIKMHMYLNTRLVDNDAITNFNAIVTDGNYISSTSEDFQFKWGLNDSQPDSRHPRYKNNYTSTGGDEYMSNFLMHYMRGLNEDAYSNPNHFDPRILFYFYRQSSATPGFGDEPISEEDLECALFIPPSHFTGHVFCGMPKGWWGRDHGDDAGVPTDRFKRTLAGVYPVGGALDDLSYEDQKKGFGNGGNGITPMLQATWTKFMIAEVKMASGDEAGAKLSLLEGMDMSWDKVYNLYPTTSRFDMIFDGVDNLPTVQSYFNDFKSEIGTDWDNGSSTDRWNILANQFFVASYGNGNNTYNFYRRTGFPTTLQPNLEASPGSFIRSFYYPSNYVTNNANASQKDNVDMQVFWDNNASSPGFPQSN